MTTKPAIRANGRAVMLSIGFDKLRKSLPGRWILTDGVMWLDRNLLAWLDGVLLDPTTQWSDASHMPNLSRDIAEVPSVFNYRFKPIARSELSTLRGSMRETNRLPIPQARIRALHYRR